MDELRDRLERCFAAVFPDLAPDEVGRASPMTLPTWDSLATVTLASVVEEEFGVPLPLEEVESLSSFELLLAHLREVTHAH